MPNWPGTAGSVYNSKWRINPIGLLYGVSLEEAGPVHIAGWENIGSQEMRNVTEAEQQQARSHKVELSKIVVVRPTSYQ